MADTPPFLEADNAHTPHLLSSNDIVTRLGKTKFMQHADIETLCDQAAAEIKRLQEQVAYRDDVISMLRADIARLGSFLHPIGEVARRG